MFEYTISCHCPTSQFIQIKLEIILNQSNLIRLQLPAWRAGRYQIANYAQNIRNFQVIQPDGQALFWEKTTKDCWTFNATKVGKYQIHYEFFAGKMDAGSSWVDDQQVYLNLVNCCFEVKGAALEPYSFQFDLEGFPQQICTLPEISNRKYEAINFQEVADSTLLAAKKLTHWQLPLHEVMIHCWFHGEVFFEKKSFLNTLNSFLQKQLNDFGGFPEDEYHFIYQLLPYTHYHGVEHKKGTVITFGPADKLKEKSSMMELIGVTSHEFYHAWNVCSIRPRDLFPYDFSKENYTKSGWILEGITTYMGDLYLLKSKIFSLEEYFGEIEKTINRVSRDFGWKNQNLLESSFDLWLDGYQAGIPDKKQNIYANGSLVAWAIDIHLHQSGSSLAKVMKHAYDRFRYGQRSYQEGTFWRVITKFGKEWKSNDFYKRFIGGNEPILKELEEILPYLGISLETRPNPDSICRNLGILYTENKIQKIHPESPAYPHLMIGDKITQVEEKEEIKISIERLNGQILDFDFKAKANFYPIYFLKATEVENELRNLWSE